MTSMHHPQLTKGFLSFSLNDLLTYLDSIESDAHLDY